MARLTPTSFGVLALLAKRPWSAYDLTKEIRRSLSQCWPRAETGLYREPKNLVAHGLARAKVAQKGRQSRTIYSITPKGRRALRKWFTQPCAPPLFESEALVKVVFAEHGSREDLLATLTEIEAQVAEMALRGIASVPDYLAEVGASPEHLADIGLAGKLFLDYYALIGEWARWARAEVERRPDEWSPDAAQAALDALRGILGSVVLASGADDAP